MKVLITGGAGFIGSNTAWQLLERGHNVVVLDDLSTGTASNLADLGCEFVEASILDAERLAVAVTGCESIIHLAALPSVPRSIANPLASHHANVTGTLEVLEAARRAGSHVVLASSSSVYGANAELPKVETMRSRPLSPYAATKAATELYAQAYQHSFGVPSIAFRFFNVFGPRQAADHAYAAVIPAFTAAALRGLPVTVHGDGRQSRDFTYVDNVARVLIDAAERRVTSAEAVNLAIGARISLLAVLDELERLIGGPIARTHVERRAGDVPHSQADTTRLRELFPSLPLVDFETGLTKTVDWMRAWLQR